ncbi:MAG: hypothetical protein GEV11_13005 [Streptosporangiales bacterium]|nr:hypothetical protein [Streptosporangiales bacterium]
MADRVSRALGLVEHALGFRPAGEPVVAATPQLVWGETAGEGVQARTDDGLRLRFRVPGGRLRAERAGPLVRYYPDAARETDVVAQPTGIGVRVLAVLYSPRAPLELRFPIDLPSVLTLEQTVDGGFDVLNRRTDRVVGMIWTPWARDVRGGEVGLTYGLEPADTGAVITARLAPGRLAYPLVLDPSYSGG